MAKLIGVTQKALKGEGLGKPKPSATNMKRNFSTTNGIRIKEELQLGLRKK